MFSSRIATSAAGIIAVSALGLAAAGTASAGTVDDEFLANIYAEGISYPSDFDAIDDAHLVCGYLDDGRTGTDISTEIMGNSDLSAHQAATIVVEASRAYCPAYFDQVVA
jgi:Protein of unknown function (DUF732)